MTITLRFERSDALAEAGFGEAKAIEVPYFTPEGEWAQFTYAALCDQSGGTLATVNQHGLWHYQGEYYSDVIVGMDERFIDPPRGTTDRRGASDAEVLDGIASLLKERGRPAREDIARLVTMTGRDLSEDD